MFHKGFASVTRGVAALSLILGVILGVLSLMASSATAITFTDSGFASETVTTLPPYTPVGLTFAPDGRMFIWQKSGVVRIFKSGALLSTPFINISARVNTVGDRGLLGFALDPNFSSNGYAYLLYTYEEGNNSNDTGPKTARLTRVTVSFANPDVADPNSEVVLIGTIGTPPCNNYPAGSDCIPDDSTSHTIGTVRFAPDGTLFVGNGDGASYTFADPDALRAQDLNRYSGKILRINPDGTAPRGNPFDDGTNSIRSKVWAYGLRNPYRFTLHPTSGEPYIGNVGWYSWEEVNRGRGANFGWPCYEGNDPQPDYQAAFTQCRQLPGSAVTSPLYTYPNNGSAIVVGAFYTAGRYPQQYQGNLFIGDYVGGWIRRMVFDANNNLLSVQQFATDVDGPVHIELGPDGLLYYVEILTGVVGRILYGSSLPPVAKASATPTSGYSPLPVSFSSAGSEGLSYLWTFGDGATSTVPNPSHTYTASAVTIFVATLKVTDAQGASSSATVKITVGSKPPTASITSPTNGTPVKPGDTVFYRGSATDPDEPGGVLSQSALSWTILLHHDSHIHTFIGGTGDGSFVVEDHGAIGTFSYELTLTATDSSGLTDVKSVNLQILRTCPCTIWSSSTTPTNAAEPDPNPVEVGVKFRADVNGFITGLRFYKSTTNTGTHVGNLWTRTGSLLASATFTNETASGWQQVNFPTPVPITSNTTYVASYHTTVGRYAADEGYFATSTIINSPLSALATGVDGGNGVYLYGAGGFPTLTYNTTNYWVDVVFNTTAPPDGTLPTVTGVSPANGTTGVAISTSVTATFSEAMDPATISTSTVELRTPSNTLVSATVTYNATTRTATLTPSASLTNLTTYTATVRGGTTDPRVKDLASNALAANFTWSFTTTPTVTTVTAFPTSTTILSGTLRGGSASSLNVDDNGYFEVNSTTSGTRTTSSYGVFLGVPNTLSNLKITYKGKNSRSCTQKVSIWRWTTSSWVQLNSRSVGTTEVLIADLVPSGTFADYVSGTSGDGELRVRIRCTRSSPSFFSSGDLMKIGYDKP